MRLWVQILKSLSRSNERDILHLAPESILIDTENNVTFDAAAARNPLYAAPEEAEGAPTDRTSVVFSAGLILHEMLTGGLENPGGKPSEAAPEVPAWLDELTVKCLAADRSLRYRDIDEIFSSLKTLKNKE